MEYIIASFVVFMILGLLIARISVSRERWLINRRQKNPSMIFAHLEGIHSFETNMRVTIELFPKEIRIIQDENTTASLNYNQILSARNSRCSQAIKISHNDKISVSQAHRTASKPCFIIKYLSESQEEKELVFVDTSGTVPYLMPIFMEALDERIPKKRPTHTAL